MRAFFSVQAALGVLVLARLASGKARRPPLAPVAGPSGAVVLVPARDEAERIGPLLRALAEDPDVAEVVVVDDRSSDGTAELARALGARVVVGAELPEGWAGKPWALHQGLQEVARATSVTKGSDPLVTVCLDADVEPASGLVAALAAEVREHGPEVLVTGLPRFAIDDPAARALHASFLTTLVLRHGPQDVDRPLLPIAATANGQCLAFDLDALQAAGGFESVQVNLTEDVALARHLTARGWTVRAVDASELLEVRPYADLQEVWAGWGRSLMAPDATSPAAQALDLATLWAVQALPLPRLLTRRGTKLDAALLALRLLLALPLSGSYRPRGASPLLAPLLDLPAVARLTWSVLRPTRRWRGRSY